MYETIRFILVAVGAFSLCMMSSYLTKITLLAKLKKWEDLFKTERRDLWVFPITPNTRTSYFPDDHTNLSYLMMKIRKDLEE